MTATALPQADHADRYTVKSGPLASIIDMALQRRRPTLELGTPTHPTAINATSGGKKAIPSNRSVVGSSQIRIRTDRPDARTMSVPTSPSRDLLAEASGADQPPVPCP